jgi:hypothetical protein
VGEPRDPRPWPRGRARLRHRHDPARWDADRTGEDLPSLAATVALTGLGGLALAGLAWWQLPLTIIVVGGLLVWSIGLEVTGGRVTTRVRGPVATTVWTLLRPAYAVGVLLWSIVEAVLELVG